MAIRRKRITRYIGKDQFGNKLYRDKDGRIYLEHQYVEWDDSEEEMTDMNGGGREVDEEEEEEEQWEGVPGIDGNGAGAGDTEQITGARSGARAVLDRAAVLDKFPVTGLPYPPHLPVYAPNAWTQEDFLAEFSSGSGGSGGGTGGYGGAGGTGGYGGGAGGYGADNGSGVETDPGGILEKTALTPVNYIVPKPEISRYRPQPAPLPITRLPADSITNKRPVLDKSAVSRQKSATSNPVSKEERIGREGRANKLPELNPYERYKPAIDNLRMARSIGGIPRFKYNNQMLRNEQTIQERTHRYNPYYDPKSKSPLIGNPFANPRFLIAPEFLEPNPSGSIGMPNFIKLWNNYPHNQFDKNGKVVRQHPSADNYENQCAIRLGYTFLKADVDMSNYTEPTTTEGYPRGAHSLAVWLYHNYKKPVIVDQKTFEKEYLNKTGIIFLTKPDEESADHIDLWNKSKTGSGYYLAKKVWFWEIK